MQIDFGERRVAIGGASERVTSRQAAVGRRETKVACVIDTVVPFGPLDNIHLRVKLLRQRFDQACAEAGLFAPGLPIRHAGAVV